MNLNELNKMQLKAVEKTEGPLLVLAGAGSGKTRVLTYRIAYLIEKKNVFPSDILAITFTNKAADEMKERINALIGGKSLGMWIGTFHSVCLRILRRDCHLIGYSSDFTIYDVPDQKTLIKNVMKKLGISTKVTDPKIARNIISSAKNELITPKQFEDIYQEEFRYQEFIKIYKEYQKQMKANNAMDFDDLINNTIKLLQENPQLLEFYKDKFRYIHIDEYQDTNYVQYLFASLLSGVNGNICAVGDGDQSIYKFRGADIRNIREFEKDYENATIIKLEQNYRSTQMILDAANSVIKNNSNRKAKNLWTDNNKGGKLKLYEAYTEKDEAKYICEKIEESDYKYDDFAILYRTNAQSRSFEDAFRKENIPYQMIGGLKFYERKEIKDVLAYLRLVQNPADDISFQRVVNEPKRGIGKRSLEKLGQFAGERSLYEALLEIGRCDLLSNRAKNAFKKFRTIIVETRKKIEELNALEIFELIIEKSGYVSFLKTKGTTKAQTRLENVFEFKTVLEDFIKSGLEDLSLSNFLAEISLQTAVDTMEEEVPGVLMMTLHSAKGLEFPNVFLVGMEENIFPSYMSMENEEDIQEERRLCYVGITRAEENLTLTYAKSRTLYGSTRHNRPSRFIGEIKEEVIEKDIKSSSKVINSYSFNKSRNKSFMRYEKPEKKKTVASNQYKAGLKVNHSTFGVGTIIEVNNKVLKIAFDGQGIKKLLADVAPIEIIS